MSNAYSVYVILSEAKNLFHLIPNNQILRYAQEDE